MDNKNGDDLTRGHYASPPQAYGAPGYPPQQGYPGYPQQGYPQQGYAVQQPYQGYQPPPQQLAPPQTVVVQQPAPKDSGPGCCCGCLATLCACCLLDALCC